MGLFKVGLRTKCPHCFRTSWHPLDALQDQLACPKCLTTFSAVGNIDSSTWCYKTVGPFSVGKYADGAFAVLITLDFLSRGEALSLSTTPVLSFSAVSGKAPEIEADFGAFWRDQTSWENREGILFGECKTYGKFEQRDFNRMRMLARAFPGAVLIFATLKRTLSASEIAGIRRIAKAGREYWKPERPINPVLVLTGAELLDWPGPPDCWSNELKGRFRNLSGLLQLCNATQQIYLDLRPWEEDWDDVWERKRRLVIKRGAQAAKRK
jgi:hypothetical protein